MYGRYTHIVSVCIEWYYWALSKMETTWPCHHGREPRLSLHHYFSPGQTAALQLPAGWKQGKVLLLAAKNTTGIPCITDPVHFTTLLYFRSRELAQTVRSWSNMNIGQQSVGTNGVSQGCFILVLNRPMYASWEEISLFMKEHLHCVAQQHQCCRAGWKAQSSQRRWYDGHLQPWCWGCFAQLIGHWAARHSWELFLLYLQTSFMKKLWGRSQAQGYFQCGQGTWSCTFASSKAVHKLDLSSWSLHSLGQGVFLAALGAVVAGTVLLPLTPAAPYLNMLTPTAEL